MIKAACCDLVRSSGARHEWHGEINRLYQVEQHWLALMHLPTHYHLKDGRWSRKLPSRCELFQTSQWTDLHRDLLSSSTGFVLQLWTGAGRQWWWAPVQDSECQLPSSLHSLSGESWLQSGLVSSLVSGVNFHLIYSAVKYRQVKNSKDDFLIIFWIIYQR